MAERPRFSPHRPRPADAPVVLQGIRIVDFTRWFAGPYCTQTLADLGAEVIKIEDPATGDDTRALSGGDLAGESGAYLSLNRNKQGIVLNLALPEAQQVARDLIAGADVVVENFSPSVMKRFGLDYATVAKGNPRLIYCSVSGYGSQGQWGSRPGYDVITQAETGFLSLTGETDRAPVRTGIQVIDIATAMNATSAILAALLAREKLGKGQLVEVALQDTAVAMLTGHGTSYLVSGTPPKRSGNTSPLAAPVGLFHTADGLIYLSCANDRIWAKFATQVIDRPDFATDPEFATNRARVRNQQGLNALLDEVFRTASGEAWMEKLLAAGVPAGVVNNIDAALTSAPIRERGLVSEIPHPSGEMMPVIASPLRLSETPVIDPVAPPTLGQHTDEVLSRVLGYSAEYISRLAEAGCFEKKRPPR